MPGLVLLVYVIALLVAPPLVRWRWGLLASLGVVALELAFVFIAHRLMIDYGLLPLLMPDPLPEHPKAKIVAYHAASFARDIDTQIVPALAALTGGFLSVVWSLGHLIWRVLRVRS